MKATTLMPITKVEKDALHSPGMTVQSSFHGLSGARGNKPRFHGLSVESLSSPIELYLSIGSNLGDREANIRAALTALNRSYGRYKALSDIIETAPAGFDSPHPFLNCCVRYEVPLRDDHPIKQCHRILKRIKTIEKTMGRDLQVEYDNDGHRIYRDRPIDIDILFFGSYKGDDSLVTIPHPRIAERDFVLIPLRQIASLNLRQHFPEYGI